MKKTVLRVLAILLWCLAAFSILLVAAGLFAHEDAVTTFFAIVAAACIYCGYVLWKKSDGTKLQNTPASAPQNFVPGTVQQPQGMINPVAPAYPQQNTMAPTSQPQAPKPAITFPVPATKPIAEPVAQPVVQPATEARSTNFIPKQSALPDNYVVFDLETTGFNTALDSIIEIGAVRVVDRKPVDKFESLVNPHKHIPEEASLVNHITDDMVANAPSIEEVLPQFLDWCGNDVLVGHNVISFDFPFIRTVSRRNLHRNIGATVIDTLPMSRALYPEERHNRVADLIVRFGIADTELHRAYSDAVQEQQCLEYMRPQVDMDPERVMRKAQKTFSAKESVPRALPRLVFDEKRERFIQPQMQNSKPKGRLFCGEEMIAISGEENAQELLKSYGVDSWLWATVSVGTVPKGTHRGEVESLVAAHIENGPNKLEVRLAVPGKYEQ